MLWLNRVNKKEQIRELISRQKDDNYEEDLLSKIKFDTAKIVDT